VGGPGKAPTRDYDHNHNGGATLIIGPGPSKCQGGIDLKITIDKSTIEAALVGISTLCDGLEQIYSYSLQGVLANNKHLSKTENAYSFTVNTYDVTRGAIATIQAVTEIIGDALLNEEIELTGAE
jgi:hypothetical protein